MVNISFPGIGIDAFSVNKVAFTLPIGSGLEIRWYGIIITFGIILAILYATKRAKDEGICFDDLLDIAIFTVIFAVIGARLYYVIFSDDKYETFYDVIAIWNGGIAIYGAIIAGAITVFCVCKVKKINTLRAFDMAAPAVMIGQIIGRWGNFMNGEAHGTEVAEGSLLYFLRMGLSKGNADITSFVHPTFLYESLWNLVGFVIINALYKKKKFDGQVFLMYLSWYGFGRMLIEGLRTDSLHLIGNIRVSQVVGFLCFIAGAILIVIMLEKARRAELSDKEYTSVYSKASLALGTEAAEVEEVSDEEDDEETDDIPDAEDISDKLKNLFEDENNDSGK